jgi:hypothetical protein
MNNEALIQTLVMLNSSIKSLNGSTGSLMATIKTLGNQMHGMSQNTAALSKKISSLSTASSKPSASQKGASNTNPSNTASTPATNNAATTATSNNINLLNKNQQKLADATEMLQSSLSGFKYLFGPAVIGGLVSTMHALTKKMDEVGKRTATLGTSLPSVTKALGPNLGLVAGRSEELSNALDILDSGLSINNAELKKVTLQNRSTGVDNKNLLKTLRLSVSTGNLNSKNLGEFTSQIAELRDTYQISTDNLVNSMAKFAGDLKLSFMGIGKQFSQVSMKFTAKFGEGTEKLFEQLTTSVLSPEMFAKRMQFGIRDIANVLMNKQSSSDQMMKASFSLVGKLAPQIDSLRATYEAAGFDQDMVLKLLGEYFGSEDLITAVEALKNIQPKELIPDVGPKQDSFANLGTALLKALAPFEELAQTMLPILVDSIGTLVMSIRILISVVAVRLAGAFATKLQPQFASLALNYQKLSYTTNRSYIVLNKISTGISLLGKTFSVLTGPIGILVGILLTFLPEFINWMSEDSDAKQNQVDATNKQTALEERKRLEDERQKAITAANEAINYETNSYLRLQSKTLDNTMKNIMFGSDLAKRGVDINEKSLDMLGNIAQLLAGQTRKMGAGTPAPQGVTK